MTQRVTCELGLGDYTRKPHHHVTLVVWTRPDFHSHSHRGSATVQICCVTCTQRLHPRRNLLVASLSFSGGFQCDRFQGPEHSLQTSVLCASECGCVRVCVCEAYVGWDWPCSKRVCTYRTFMFVRVLSAYALMWSHPHVDAKSPWWALSVCASVCVCTRVCVCACVRVCVCVDWPLTPPET